MEVLLYMLLIYVCCMIIWRASEGFEAASSYLGDHWGLSEGVKGATINAVGSSLPELLTSIFFLLMLRKDLEGFAGGIGTTAGSAIFNGMIIPAAAILGIALVQRGAKIRVSRRVVLRDGIALILAEVLLITLLNGSQLNWVEGLALMAFYGLYLLVMFRLLRKNPLPAPASTQPAPPPASQKPGWKKLLLFEAIDLKAWVVGSRPLTHTRASRLLAAATLSIALACFVLVHACEALGRALDIHVYFVAVILASMATSVPDTFISMRDAQNGNYDDAISNALGSNIFDICFALGLPLFLYTFFVGPITIESESAMLTAQHIRELRILLLILTISAFFIYLAGKYMNVLKAWLFIGLYLLFATYILGVAYQWKMVLAIQSTFFNGL